MSFFQYNSQAYASFHVFSVVSIVANDIQKYDFKEGLPQEFELLDIGELYENWTEEMTTPHRAEFYQVFWFQEEESTHFVDFEPINIKRNTCLFINKNSVQRFDRKRSSQGKAILFTDSFFAKTTADLTFLRSNILFNDLLSISHINVEDSMALFSEIFQQIETELKNPKDDNQSDILRNHLHNLLLHSERERRKQDFVELKKNAELEFVLQFKGLLDESFVKHKKVSFYCDQLHLTPKKLNQATTKVFGKTPKQIIDERVLLEIKRLLVNTNQSVKEIAFYMGFDEYTNFIKYFKKHTCKTPVEFRMEFTLD